MTLKITDELITQVTDFSNRGATYDVIYDLYRTKGMSMKKVGESLSEILDEKVTVKHVNALFALHNMEVKTVAEQKRDTAKLPKNSDKTKAKISQLNELGFTKDKIISLYQTDKMSKNEIIDKINKGSLTEIVNKGWLIRVFDYYKIEQRDSEELNRLRMSKVNSTLAKKRENEPVYGIGVSVDEIVELYKTGLSLADIYRETGVAMVTASRLIQDRGIVIRKGRKFRDVIDDLNKKGFDEERIREEYVSKELNFTTLAKLFSNILGYNVSRSSCGRILEHFEIVRSVEQISRMQSVYSKRVKAAGQQRLSRAGFSSLEALAKYYDENKSLTKNALVKKLNENVLENETPFTERWLGRHMDPLLPEGRLKGTSRVEREFSAEFTKLLDVDEEVHLGSYKIISPYQLDVYLPNLNLAVEFNGDYWHSDRFMLKNHGMTARAYHEMKLARCEELGIRLLFVWECDWLGHRDEVIAALEEVLSNSASEPEILSVLSLDELFEAEEEIDAA